MNSHTRICMLLILAFAALGCSRNGDPQSEIDTPLAQSNGISLICTQTNAAEATMPNGFKVTPSDAINKAAPFFIGNPFVLIVYADSQYYYVDIASKTAGAETARTRGVKIDGKTGKIVRGEERIIGK